MTLAVAAAAAEGVGRAFDGEEEGVDEGGDGDDGDQSQNEFEGGEVHGAWRRRKRRRRSDYQGGVGGSCR